MMSSQAEEKEEKQQPQQEEESNAAAVRLPVVAKPHAMNCRLDRDRDYWWCSCGLSPEQPWCDGSSCTGTGFQPVLVRCTGAQTLFPMCCCKHTKSPPFCDGNHIHLQW